MKHYIAGLDIGGTTGRLKIEYLDGKTPGEIYGQGCSINTDGGEKSERRYRELVLPALAEWGLHPQDCQGICIAASGIDSPELEQLCYAAFLSMGFRQEAILIKNDCEIFLDLSAGLSLVLVAGTGSICYGRNAGGRVIRTGGWGHILSDDGSAFGMGLDILRCIGDHLDERTSCPVLYRGFHKQTGISSLPELNEYVNKNLMNKAVIGALAPIAESSCHEGEEAGISIIRKNAQSLERLVTDTCRKMSLGQEEAAPLWLWGSVILNNIPLKQQVERLIRDSYPAMTIRIPDQRALDVALGVAREHVKGGR